MVVIPDNIQKILDQLTDAVREDELYIRYQHCRQEIEKNPELFAVMDRYRHETLALTMRLEHGESLEQELRTKLTDGISMCSNPVVREFLDAELKLCILLRKILLEIGSLPDFRLDAYTDLL